MVEWFDPDEGQRRRGGRRYGGRRYGAGNGSARDGGTRTDGTRTGTTRKRRSIADLPREEQVAKARDIVYRQLGVMDRSRHELEVTLGRREVPEDVREEVLGKFVKADLVNDERFAHAFAHSLVENSGASKRAVREKLQRKGIGRDLIEQVLGEIDGSAELESAVALAEKKLRVRSGKEETLWRRTYAALARRGFSSATCSAAMRIAQDRVREEQA